MVQAETSSHNRNVGAAERLASIAAGAFLVGSFIRKRSRGSLIGALLGADLIKRGATGRCEIYRTFGVNTATKDKWGSEISDRAPRVHRSITIGRSPQELLALWSEPHTMERILADYAEVDLKSNNGQRVSHWRVRGPWGQALEWESEEFQEPGRALAWRSLPGTELPNRGAVTFRPGPDGVGTEVMLELQFEPPLGPVGERLVKSLRKGPRMIAGQALRRFKSLAETGEIPTLLHNPSGRGSSDTF